MAEAKFVNKDKILARLRAMPAGVTEAARAELKKQVDELAEAMKRAAPVLKSPAPDRTPGALRESIHVRPGHRPLSYIISAGGPLTTVKVRAGVSHHDFQRALQSGGHHGEFDYARAVEFGHMTPAGGHVPANPFFYPVYRARKAGMKAAIRAAVRKRLKADFPGVVNG